ncbi:MAG: AAA family ATPase [Candidatus Thiodiazotropha lotti]|nr:AAA family ATPase [Candidatus Thiodiazotropha lotti]
MRITSLTLRNFKAIGANKQRVDFRPITLLYGPNSAGKSTIVQALHYLSEILSRNNCDPGTTQIGGKLNLGGFRNLVHLHDSDSFIELGLGLSLDDSLLPSYGGNDEEEHLLLGEMLGSEQVYDLSQVSSVEIRLGIRWSQQLQMAYVADYVVAVNGEDFARISASADQRQIILNALNCDHTMFGVPLIEDEETTTVGDALQGLLDEFATQPVSMDGTTVATLLQLRSGRGAMPEFGRLLPLDSSIGEVDPRGLMSGTAIPRLNNEAREQLERERLEIQQLEFKFQALNRYLSRIVVGAGELARDCLQQFIYLGPLREIPGRHYSPELSPGLGRWSSGLGAWDQLYNEGEALADKVNAWLGDDKRLDAGYEVHYSEYKPLPLDSALMVALQTGSEWLESSDWVQTQLNAISTHRQVTLWDQRADIHLHPEDLGTGISQVLPVLVAALGHNKNIVAVEQPELHVHPKFQVALGELFIHAVKDESIARDTVFILETHSEYMMLRFLRRLYETANDELEPDAQALSPEDITVYYVNPAGDSVEINHLRLTEEGEFLDRWPNGFFPERKQELF